MHDFTPCTAAIGGALIALSLGVMLVATGRIAGLSGVFAGVLRVGRAGRGDWAWRACFVGGMLAAGAVFEAVRPESFDAGARVPLAVVALAGALVGAGTRLSNGCTSGHGLCGMSRASKRSIVATLTFFAVGVVTATIVGRLL